jgi:hypothetical protein
MQPYKIYCFNRADGTFTVNFTAIQDCIFNYNAPRLNGVYLAGQELEAAIQLLLKPLEELTEEDMQLRFPQDDPSTVTGGEDIEAKVGQ